MPLYTRFQSPRKGDDDEFNPFLAALAALAAGAAGAALAAGANAAAAWGGQLLLVHCDWVHVIVDTATADPVTVRPYTCGGGWWSATGLGVPADWGRAG